MGRTRHLLIDRLELLLAVVVTSADLSDPAGAWPLFKRIGGAREKPRRLWVVDGPLPGSPTIDGWPKAKKR